MALGVIPAPGRRGRIERESDQVNRGISRARHVRIEGYVGFIVPHVLCRISGVNGGFMAKAEIVLAIPQAPGVALAGGTLSNRARA
jgi:hypothetical protein